MSFAYPFPIGLQGAENAAAKLEPDPSVPVLPTLILPSFDLPRYRYTITLSGAVYGIEIALNRRDGHRYFSLSHDSEPVLSGVRLLPGWPIRRSVRPGMPPGDFVPLDSETIAYVEAE